MEIEQKVQETQGTRKMEEMNTITIPQLEIYLLDPLINVLKSDWNC